MTKAPLSLRLHRVSFRHGGKKWGGFCTKTMIAVRNTRGREKSRTKIPTNPRLPRPALRRRTCAARTGASDRRKVSPRNCALCARFRKKRCPPPHPPAFLSGSTGFLFALKRKRVECQHHVNICGILTRTPATIKHHDQQLRYSNEDTGHNPAPRQLSTQRPFYRKK